MFARRFLAMSRLSANRLLLCGVNVALNVRGRFGGGGHLLLYLLLSFVVYCPLFI